MTDRLLRATTRDGALRLVAACTTTLCQECCSRHSLAPVPALALSRALTATALAGIIEKDFRRISVQWLGRGSLGTVSVDLRPPGDLRGFTSVPQGGGPGRGERGLGFGAGMISVLRQDPKGKLYRGQTPLISADVDGDLEAYLRQSEQVPSRLRVQLRQGPKGRPEAVSGLLIQALPGTAGRAAMSRIASSFLDRELEPSEDLEALMAAALPGVELRLHEQTPLRFACGCNLERVADGVALLGAAELAIMIARGEPAEVRCDYCGEDYVIEGDGLREILDRVDEVELSSAREEGA